MAGDTFPARLTRRDLLKLLGTGAGMVALAGCAPISNSPAASPPQATAGPTTVSPTSAPKTPPTAQPTVAAAASPKKGGKLTVGYTAELVNFDPNNLSLGNQAMRAQVYNSLMSYDANGKLQPELAESWKLSDDGKSLTMNLRKDVKFHDGRQFTADDVVFSLERMKDPKLAANGLLLAQTVAKSEAPDPYTVIFRYDKPNAAPYELIRSFFIVDKNTIGDLKGTPNGTGPFKIAQWLPGDKVRLVRNEKYWRPDRPYLDECVLVVMPDQQAMMASLQAGAIDAVQNPAFTQYMQVKDNPGLQTVMAPSGAMIVNLLLNVTRPPFDNKKVRQAMNLAINRKRYIDVAFGGLGKPLGLPFPPGGIGWDDNLNNQATVFDLDKAKQLLADAGFPNGFEATIAASNAAGVERTQLAQILQADLLKIGVKLKIDNPEAVAYRQMFLSGNYQMAAHTSSETNKDPSTIFGMSITYSPANGSTHFKSDQYTQLTQDGASTLDAAKRNDIYKQVAALLVDEAAILVAADRPLMQIAGKSVMGARLSQEGYLMYEDTWINK